MSAPVQDMLKSSISMNFSTENYRWELSRVINQEATSIIATKTSEILSSMVSREQSEICDQCFLYENANLLSTNRHGFASKSFRYRQVHSGAAVSILVRNKQFGSAFINPQPKSKHRLVLTIRKIFKYEHRNLACVSIMDMEGKFYQLRLNDVRVISLTDQV